MLLDNQPPLEPVHPDLFAQWRDHLVTQHLIRDLEISFIDSLLDPLPLQSIDNLAIEAIRRETIREIADLIMEWVPKGVETTDDADE